MRKIRGYWEWICLLVAVAVILLFGLITPFHGLSDSAMLVLGIFIGSVFLWMTVGISWPSLFCLLTLAFVPEFTMNGIVASSVGNPAITFLIFTFCCSYALNQTQFTRRCAVWFLTTRLAKRGPWWFLCLYFTSILLLGSCMSTTVIVVIYLTVNEEVFRVLNLKKGDKFAAMMTMGLVITASISGAMTPIAHVFPLMALNIYQNLTDSAISYAVYMAGGIPAAIVTTVAMLLIFRFVLRPDTAAIRSIETDSLRNTITPADRREKITAAVFFLVVALWVLPDLVKGFLPGIAEKISSFGTVMPPLLGTILLCVLQVEGEPLLKLKDGMKSVPWPSLLMAASALALGSAMTDQAIGLSEFIKTLIGPLVQSLEGMHLAAVLISVCAIMTNVGSNMVTVTILSTVALPIAVSMGDAIHPGALAVVIGMMSAYAWATPPAMTTVVLGTGSGWTTNAQMARYGFLVLVPGILAVSFLAYPLCVLLL